MKRQREKHDKRPTSGTVPPQKKTIYSTFLFLSSNFSEENSGLVGHCITRRIIYHKDIEIIIRHNKSRKIRFE
jgi:hypothetical protein